jgi:hypothetical protein
MNRTRIKTLAGIGLASLVLSHSVQAAPLLVLYAYFNADADAGTQPMLIQQVKYLPPFKASATPYPLTGEQRLYAGTAERELIYSCTLEGVQP